MITLKWIKAKVSTLEYGNRQPVQVPANDQVALLEPLLSNEQLSINEQISVIEGILIEAGINGYEIDDCDEMRNFLTDNPLQWDYVDEELMNRNERAAVIFYVTDDLHGQETLLSVNTLLKPYGLLTELENCDDEDWLSNWKKYYKPFTIGSKIAIRPVWEEYENPDQRIVFCINPGHVFGTGLHQTTRLCIEALENYVNDKTNILDLGCGSGILSLIALLLGAKQAFALDLEPAAAMIYKENAQLNGIKEERYTIETGNILSEESLLQKVGAQKYEIVVANIVADVILALIPMVKGWLKADGVFISSGIIQERVDEVLAALNEEGFDTVVFSLDNWYCIVAKNSTH